MTISINRLKTLSYILLPVGIAYYIMLPLLARDYIYPTAEYELYKSFMINFIETLKKGELPTWNEYAGCGHPAMYFGHYPISQNTFFYMYFGFNDFTYYFTKFLGLTILLLSTTYAFQTLGFSYLYALVGALVYFSVNFVIRIMVAETIGNLLFVYPLLIIFTIKSVAENKRRDILIFNLVYIFWLSGGHIIYVYMHLAMLSLIYWIAVFVFHGFRALKLASLTRFVLLYCVTFIVPFSTVLYQYYFVYDVISNSNRLKEGLILSPFESTVWKQLLVSFQSSSYFWFGLLSVITYTILKFLPLGQNYLENIRVKITVRTLYFLLVILLCLIAIGPQLTSNFYLISDYLPILSSAIFLVALVLFFIIHFVLNGMPSAFYASLKEVFIFAVFVSLLSHYFFSPENIPGDVKGYDYDLFREMSIPFQILFTLSVLFSSREYSKEAVVKIVVLSAIALYLLRSHFTIPLLRFAGIVWYAPRDGSIFSVFFAVLFMYGLRNLLSHLSQLFKNSEDLSVKWAKHGFLVLILVLLVHDSFNKFYKGMTHRFIYPNKRELAKSSMENWLLDGREEVAALKKELLALDKKREHFYRLFKPENHYFHILAGNMQHHNIHEAAIYESSISRELQGLYDTILGKDLTYSKDLKDVLPYFLFTKHVHAGLGLKHNEIPYHDVFMFFPTTDVKYVQNQNIEFFWDLTQVKYIIIGPEFSKVLEGFASKEDYRLLERYPKLNLNLYEILKDKSYSRLAILPLDGQQSYDEVIRELNSADINTLRALYSKLVFLDASPGGLALAKNQGSNGTKHYEIFSEQDAILIDFESWNHNWGLRVNGKDEKLQKAFQMFKGIRLQPGLNQIELTYNLKYFKGLFIVSIFAILLYIALLILPKIINKKQSEIFG